MEEKLNAKFEHGGVEADEISTNHEAQPPQAEQRTDVKIEKQLDIQKTREIIDKIHKPSGGQMDLSVPLPNLAPVVDTITKTWGSIRQNLSPTNKVFSKVIHNPVVSNISEATAKTLARPYAILAGGVTTLVGSSVYLYFTKHLGYQYNYFVPILLFAAGLVVGIVVEILFKSLTFSHKK